MEEYYNSACAKTFCRLMEDLNKQRISSYADYDKLNEEGKLVPLLHQYDLINMYERELVLFFNTINNSYYDNKPELKFIELNRSGLVETSVSFDQFLCRYFNNLEAYRVFPLLMYEACRKYSLYTYKNMKYEELEAILRRNLELKYYYNPNSKRNLVDVVTKNIDKIKYRKYEEYKISHGNILTPSIIVNETMYDMNNDRYKDLISVYGEELALSEEEAKLKYINGSVVDLVSRSAGDGYGYDLYSYNPIEMIEKLIEVKTGQSETIRLTENELNRAIRTADERYSEYYVYKYYYNHDTDKIKKTVLKFDKERLTFIDNEGFIYEMKKAIEKDEYNYDKIVFYLDKQDIKEAKKKI